MLRAVTIAATWQQHRPPHRHLYRAVLNDMFHQYSPRLETYCELEKHVAKGILNQSYKSHLHFVYI